MCDYGLSLAWFVFCIVTSWNDMKNTIMFLERVQTVELC